jgi:hypothetical protein
MSFPLSPLYLFIYLFIFHFNTNHWLHVPSNTPRINYTAQKEMVVSKVNKTFLNYKYMASAEIFQ